MFQVQTQREMERQIIAGNVSPSGVIVENQTTEQLRTARCPERQLLHLQEKTPADKLWDSQ